MIPEVIGIVSGWREPFSGLVQAASKKMGLLFSFFFSFSFIEKMGLVNFRAVMDFDAFADLFDLLARFERGSLAICGGAGRLLLHLLLLC